MTARIDRVLARRVWDGGGRPALEVEIVANGGQARGRAIAPWSPTVAPGDAHDLRDGGAAFGGLGVALAIDGVMNEIDQALHGQDAADQEAIDRLLATLDGTPTRSRLGGNSLLATSLAAARAAATAHDEPLWHHLAAGAEPGGMPLPRVEILSGYGTAGLGMDLASVVVIAVGADDYISALDWSAEVHRAAGIMLKGIGADRGLGQRGGHVAIVETNQQAIEIVLRAIERAGFTPGEDLALGLGIAASQLGRAGRYVLACEGRRLDSDGLIELLLGWIARYPVISLEDPLGFDDARGMMRIAAAAGSGIEIAGADLIASDARKVGLAHEIGACNAVIVSPARAGSLSATKAALEAAKSTGMAAILAGGAGESEDTALVQLAVGWGADQVACGGIARSEHAAKWNEGVRIAEQLPGRAALLRSGRLRW